MATFSLFLPPLRGEQALSISVRIPFTDGLKKIIKGETT